MGDLLRAAGSFPPTRLSVISMVASGSASERRDAFATLAELYWKPVYKYTRLRWRVTPEEAEDLTQGFFARAIEKDVFAAYEPARGKFRTFLRVCLDGFIGHARQADARRKRGGGVRVVSLDIDEAEDELRRQEPASVENPDQYFEQEWARMVLATAVARLRHDSLARDRGRYFEVFERYDLQNPDRHVRQADLAQALGLSSTDVANYLVSARRDFRRIVLDCLRELTWSDEEFRAEAVRLLGVRP